MEQYMKNRFPFIGVDATERREALKSFNQSNPWHPDMNELRAFVLSCWELPWREMHYCGQEELYRHRKHWGATILPLFEHLITNQSWWDSVDYIASKILGHHFQKHPGQIRPAVSKWLKGQNMWLLRCSLLFQLKHKTQTDEALLAELVEKLASHHDFFIRKAIGWALREYGKTNPEFVLNIVSQLEMSGLSKREATRLLNKYS